MREVVSLVLALFVHGILISWVADLRRNPVCDCSISWKREFIAVSSVLQLGLAAAAVFVGSPALRLALLVNQLINFAVCISYVVDIRRACADRKVCSASWKADFAIIYPSIALALAALAIVFGATGLVSTASVASPRSSRSSRASPVPVSATTGRRSRR